MAINVSVQYDGGFLPDIILLTQCYYHRGTRLNDCCRLPMANVLSNKADKSPSNDIAQYGHFQVCKNKTKSNFLYN